MSDRLKDAGYGKLRGAPKGDAVSKYKRLQQEHNKGVIGWQDAPQEELMQAIASVTEDGAAILLSKTSDGGALVLRILDGPTSTPFYPSNVGALNEVLEMILEIAGKA